MAQQIRLAICGLAELARHGAGRQQAPDPTGRTTGHDQQRGRADPRRTGWHCGTVVCTWPAMRSACRGPVTVRTWPSFGSGAAEGQVRTVTGPRQADLIAGQVQTTV